jgi:RNA polymerase sigma-70 factor (ECF subfamily)
MGGEAGQFHTTRWTLVKASAHDQNQTGREALAALCQTYWYPLYAFARRRGYAQHDAQDLTQGFFLHLLEHRGLGRADPLKGKFRSFLLGSFQNLLADAAEMARCLKRGGNREIISLDAQDAESRYVLEPADDLTAENIFEARWAMTLQNIFAEIMKTLESASRSTGEMETYAEAEEGDSPAHRFYNPIFD